MTTRPYPGRGCLLASSQGERVIVYFVTGRSGASRNRRLAVQASSVLVTNRAGSDADTLRHYRAAALEGDWLVVGNGDHVDTVLASLAAGAGLLESTVTMEAEPDPPLWTPRIWAAVRPGRPEQAFAVGHARRRVDGGTTRAVWSVTGLPEGVGLLLTTYCGSAHDVAIAEAPVEVIHNAHAPGQLLDALWASLDPHLRVGAALVRPDTAETFSLTRQGDEPRPPSVVLPPRPDGLRHPGYD